MSTIFCPVLSRNFLSDLKTNLTKFELSTTFRAQDMQPVRFLLERLFSLKVGLHSICLSYVFLRTENASAFFTYLYANSIRTSVFLSSRRKRIRKFYVRIE